MNPQRRFVLRIVLAALFLVAGTLHVIHPSLFIEIVPPGFGDRRLDVWLSGWLEILGGCALLLSQLRIYACWGLIVLLMAVWPANWYMALAAEHFRHLAPAWVLWVRVPLQVVLIGLVYAAK